MALDLFGCSLSLSDTLCILSPRRHLTNHFAHDRGLVLSDGRGADRIGSNESGSALPKLPQSVPRGL